MQHGFCGGSQDAVGPDSKNKWLQKKHTLAFGIPIHYQLVVPAQQSLSRWVRRPIGKLCVGLSASVPKFGWQTIFLVPIPASVFVRENIWSILQFRVLRWSNDIFNIFAPIVWAGWLHVMSFGCCCYQHATAAVEMQTKRVFGLRAGTCNHCSL